MKSLLGALTMTLALTPLPQALAETADEAAVKTIVESVGVFADRHEFSALEKLYADEVLIDYSSLNGEAPEIKSPQSLMTEWASVLPGFDRTRHALSSIRSTVDGASATATADVSAGHWINASHWQVDGTYTYALRKVSDQWKITSMTFTVTGEEGSRDVFGPAIEAATAQPADYILRQQTRAAIRQFLEGLEEKDMSKVNSVWAEDAVQHMPYVPEGLPDRVVGRDALVAQYENWPETAASARFTEDLVIYPLQDPQMAYAEFQGEVEVVPTGKTYRQTYGGLFHVEGGKIALYREYFDPRLFADAFALSQ